MKLQLPQTFRSRLKIMLNCKYWFCISKHVARRCLYLITFNMFGLNELERTGYFNLWRKCTHIGQKYQGFLYLFISRLPFFSKGRISMPQSSHCLWTECSGKWGFDAEKSNACTTIMFRRRALTSVLIANRCTIIMVTQFYICFWNSMKNYTRKYPFNQTPLI